MSIIRHSFHIITKQFAYFLVIVAVLLTVFVGTVYWLSEAVEQRQDEIADWVGNKLGYPVEIGSAGLHWLGLVPKLQVENITVLREEYGAELLSLKHLYFGLDIVASIKQREPVLNDITLTGLSISVVRDELGNIRLQGLNESTQSSVDILQLLSWAKLLNRIHLYAISVDYTDQKYSSLSGVYKLTNAAIKHKATRWTTTANIHFPATLGTGMLFDAQWTLEDNWSDSVWQWKTKLKDVQLASLSEQLVWQDIAIKQGIINANLSSNGVGNQTEAIKAELALVESELISQEQGLVYTPVLIEQLTGKFDWQSQQQEWQLSANEIQLQMNGDIWPKTAFTVSKSSDDSLLIDSNYLRLSDITSVALLTTKSPEMIRQQRPAGDVEKFSLHYSIGTGISNLAFNLRDGVLLPWKDYVGVTGLTATVSWQDDHGSLDFDSHKLTLYPEKWLDDSVFFDSVSGSISLQKDNDYWRVKSNEFRVWNDDLTLQLDGSVERTADGKTVNDLKLTLEEVVVERWKSYVPQQVLSKNFKEWSATAFQAGKIIDGVIELKGELSAFPYEKSPDKGQFNMLLTVEDIHLHYAPDWPDLLGVNGTITSTGNDLIIKSQHGEIAEFNFVDVTTIISKLVEDNPILQLNGDLKGTTVQALQFLQNSPLKPRFGGVAEEIEANGASDINLSLMVPLADTDATEVKGHVSFVDSQMKTKEFPDVVLSQINGLLQFSHQAVSAEAIQAQLLSEPVTINVRPDGDVTIVSANGQIASEQVKELWPNSLLNSISGKAAYQLELAISEKDLGDFNVDVMVNSNLRGVEFDLPEPLAKNSDDVKAFQMGFEHIDNSLVYSIKYDELFNAIVMPDEDLWSGEVRFGVGKAQLPDHGLKVRGQLAELAVDDWLQWAEKLPEQDGQTATNIDDVSLAIEKLTAFDQQLTGLNLSAQRDAQGWRMNIRSDQTKGSIYFPTDFNSSSALKVDLDKVNFVLPKKESDNTDNSDDPPSTLWPAIDIKIGSLSINDIALGELQAQAHRNPNTWILDSATLTSDVFSASIPVGMWQQLPSGDRSHFELKANSADLGELLTNFDYQQAIEAESISIETDFSWADSPLNVSSGNINGTLGFDVGKGKLKDVEPGAAGRIFGLLSVAAIPRRLSLDFSDLFEKGFSFDSIAGTFELANGQAVTDDLILNGTTAKIEMTGPIDLINKQYDQQVKVTPDVSSTLPVAGAVGGPIGIGVGAAILLVDKLVDKLFDKDIVNFISYRYHLTGAWDDPQLNVVKPARAQ